MGGSGSDDFDFAGFLKFAESGEEFATVSIPSFARLPETVEIHFGEGLELLFPEGAVRFFFGEFDEGIEVALVAFAQKLILEHRTESGRERNCEPAVNAVDDPAINDVDQRDVGFGDRFVEPILLQKSLMLRMAHIREMAMKDECKVTFHES